MRNTLRLSILNFLLCLVTDGGKELFFVPLKQFHNNVMRGFFPHEEAYSGVLTDHVSTRFSPFS